MKKMSNTLTQKSTKGDSLFYKQNPLKIANNVSVKEELAKTEVVYTAKNTKLFVPKRVFDCVFK